MSKLKMPIPYLLPDKVFICRKGLPLQTTNTVTKIGNSVLSLFICNTVVCQAATTPSAGLNVIRFSNYQDGLNDPKRNKI